MARNLHLANKKPAFTLVEIMIVVVIIGLLAAMSVPAIKRARTEAYASRIANNFRVFSGSFETHALDTGSWAPDGSGNELPDTVAPYFEGSTWYEPPIPGGFYDWDFERNGITAAISLLYTKDMPEVFTRVDDLLDDGDLATGDFFKSKSRYFYILER